MALYYGNKKVKDLYIGSSQINKMYLGEDLVYEAKKWTCIWKGLRLMGYGFFYNYEENEEHNDLCYPGYETSGNNFGLIAGAPTQVSAALHGSLAYGCIGLVLSDDAIEFITANCVGDQSNVPWITQRFGTCSNAVELLYMDGNLLYQSDQLLNLPIPSHGGMVVVTEIWQKI